MEQKPSFIAIPSPKHKEIISTPLQNLTLMASSPTNTRSGANTPSFHHGRQSVTTSNMSRSISSNPLPNSVSPQIPFTGVEFPVRRSILQTNEQLSSYFP